MSAIAEGQFRQSLRLVLKSVSTQSERARLQRRYERLKMDGIFHYFNESFVIDPLNDFERHFAWLSKTSLLLKIG